MASDTTGTDWKATIQLPETEFPMRANLAEREQAAVARWRDERLYHRILAHRSDAPVFTLHDGPPYANGEIHHGHALNKILKDIVVKYRTLAGFRASNIPGWDCHGLPIEQKVDEQLGKAKREMTTVAFRQACRDYADHWVGVQRDGFERLMVFAEWERPYRTMDFSYEASITRMLGEFMGRGYVYNGLKPVHWSWSAVTALAEAEVEYDRYVAPSVYVKFEMPNPPDWLATAAAGRRVNPVIWTTTPWTLPSNLAIVLHPELAYELLALNDAEAIIVAEGLKASVLEACGLDDLPVLHRFDGHTLVGYPGGEVPRPVARHPFIDRDSVLLPAEYVTLEQGTGCVHTAPGHGADDFDTGRKYGLDVLAPVNQYGKYTADVPDYEGMHVFKANPLIAERLAASGRLLNQAGDTYVVDRYPHCWRTKKPLIFRATAQWFIRVDHEGLRDRALQLIGETKWVPHWGENRIRGMIEARPDWCISRQRAWGVPIPAFHCAGCDNYVVSQDVANHVADLTEQEGSDVWFARDVEALVPEGMTCPTCGGAPSGFTKVEDILDVWFDSGVSWAAVLRDREGLPPQADLYLEGSDQHRGWFHTSLLTASGVLTHAPYKSVLTHGFVVDEHGHKYSKSSPKFEPLDAMLTQHGAEILRLWVAMVDYRHDMTLAPELLKQTSGAYRKIRNTIRFLLGSLSGFQPSEGGIEVDTLTPIDGWALARTAEFVDTMRAAYEAYEFHTVYRALYEFCNLDMSAVYLDVLKDRLYCDAPDAPARRASQAVLYEALRAILISMSPVLTFTADEAWSFLARREGDPDSVFLAEFPTVPDAWRGDDPEFLARLALRSRIQEAIEAKRPQKKGERMPGQIGSSQEAVVTLTVPADRVDAWDDQAFELAELAIVSEVNVVAGTPSDPSGVDVSVAPATSGKCLRCWNYREEVGQLAAYPDLCGRCATVVERIA